MYLSISEEAISSVLVQEADQEQKPVYFVSRTLQDAERRYQTIEKVALALVHTARRMRAYFQNHPVVVKTDYPIRKVLTKPDLAGRMIGWSVELSEFGITYEPRGAIRSQRLADFLVELSPEPASPSTQWVIYVDGSSNAKGSGAGIILEGPAGLTIEQSLRFDFKTTNNQAEYEAIIAGLSLAKEMGAEEIQCRSDSKLTVGHLTGEFQVKDHMMMQYY